MKRLLPAVVLTFAASASCMLDLKGMASTSSDNQAATTTGSGGGTTATASSGTTGAGGAGGAQSTSTATSSSTGAGGPLFTWRRKLDLDSGVDTPLSNFSILVLLEKGERIDYGHTQNKGEDLRFTDDQHQVLEHEIERWDEGGTSVVWVRIPSLKPNASPLPAIWMYYGNAKANDGQDVNGVWSDGYQGVWHLGESGDDLSDSSGKTPIKATNHNATQSAGLFGKGRSFDAGKLQYIDTNNFYPLGRFTIEVLARSDNAPVTDWGPNGPLMRENNYQIMWDHESPYAGSVSFNPLGPQDWTSTNLKPLAANTWYYLAATFDGLTLRTFKDGVFQDSDIAAYPGSTMDSAKIGRHAYLTQDRNHFNGDIDEVRIADTNRSDEWFVAQNRSLRDTLVKFGPEESSGGPWSVP
ncbi:MAG: DUF2341 domain-containing protein [Byssovorax sp.]